MTALALASLLGLLGAAALVAVNLRWFRRAPSVPVAPAAVSVLLPARNEAGRIEAAVRGACAQPGVAEVVVLDDGSTDDTPVILARLARELPCLRVVRGEPLPEGWAGKAWACWQLATRHARGDWALFVDCDVRLAPDAAGRVLAAARASGADFLSAFPRQAVGSVGEALIVPLIHLVLLAYLPMFLVRRLPMPALSAGCGQLMLARREAYLAADGHRAIRATLHDGLMLARRMKAAGFVVDVLDGSDLAACRMYEGLGATWRGFARNAYEALGTPGALAVMTALNALLFVAPFVGGPLALLAGSGAAAVAWGLAAAAGIGLRLVLARRFGAPWWTALATPLAVALMIGIQWHAFLNHVTGRRVVWRERSYPLRATGGAR